MATKPREEIRTQDLLEKSNHTVKYTTPIREIPTQGETPSQENGGLCLKAKKVPVILRRRRGRIKSKLKEISKRDYNKYRLSLQAILKNGKEKI